MNSGISVTAMLCIFATVFCAGLGLTVVPYVYIGEVRHNKKMRTREHIKRNEIKLSRRTIKFKL